MCVHTVHLHMHVEKDKRHKTTVCRTSLYHFCHFPGSLDYFKIKRKTDKQPQRCRGSAVGGEPGKARPIERFLGEQAPFPATFCSTVLSLPPERTPSQLLLRWSFCDHRPLALWDSVRLANQETETTPGHSSILFEHFLPVAFPLWWLEGI